ncbi:MAG TPA: c-type cytochrome [Alphaproteobacteria bacterium]|nr:c-type cytochrome [Alphaproteobacteria bacterium]
MTGRAILFAATLAFAAVAPAPVSASGDATRGARIFQMCVSCHTVDPAEAGKRLPGPALVGVFGRAAGALASFPDYSDHMISAGRRGLVWDAPTIDAYVGDPISVIPGTTMNFFGIADAKDRADLIAYLRRANGIDK